jgi:hypothetical protein
MLMIGLFSLIRSNRHAFNACCALIAVGGIMTGAATVIWQAGYLGPQLWLAAVGVGMYSSFIAYQAIIFERLLASLRVIGTAAFLITLCDSYGYLSTIGLYFLKVFSGMKIAWVKVLMVGGYGLGILLPILMLFTVMIFNKERAVRNRLQEQDAVPE